MWCNSGVPTFYFLRRFAFHYHGNTGSGHPPQSQDMPEVSPIIHTKYDFGGGGDKVDSKIFFVVCLNAKILYDYPAAKTV